MIKKRFKKLSILFITIFTFILSDDVYAGRIKVTAYKSDADKQTIWSVGTTYPMEAVIDGQTVDVYCAYHGRLTPPPGEITYTIRPISDSVAIGVATIIEDGTDVAGANTVTSGYSTKYRNVIKTIALNLYLSKKDGNNRFANADWYDSSWWEEDENGYTPDAVTPLYKNRNNLNAIISGFQAAYNAKYDGNSATTYDEEQAAVYELYLNAMNATPAEEPYLLWDTTRSEALHLDGSTYRATYYVTTNMEISDLDIEVTGVNASSVTKSVSISERKISISFPESAVLANAEQIQVVGVATTTRRISTIYTGYGAEYQDVIIAGPSGPQTYTIRTDSSATPVERTCYRYETNCTQTACTNDPSNERVCNSTVTQYTARTCGADSSTLASGRHTKTLINGICSLYCKESATVYYPGNVKKPVYIDYDYGTNLQWPTNLGGDYPLQTIAKMDCTIEYANGANENASFYSGGRVTTIGQACRDVAAEVDYSNGDNSAQVRYEDARNGSQTIGLKRTCAPSNTSVNGNQVTITNNCYYTLEATNNMISKETYEYVELARVSTSDAVTNYYIINEHNGVLPINGITWNDYGTLGTVLFSDVYDLEIENMSLGYNNQFGGTSAGQLNYTEYICHYKATTDNSGTCVCPPGTKYSTMELNGALKPTASTCAEAIEIYCNSDTDNFELRCPPGTDHEGKDLSPCVEQDDDGDGLKNSYEYCVQRDCYGDTNLTCMRPDGTVVDITNCVHGYSPYDMPHSVIYCEYEAGCYITPPPCEGENCYYCPQNTPKYPMDITSCVETEMDAGRSEESAKEYCIRKECYDGDGGSGEIIYRTISLETPFVGKEADTDLWTATGGLMDFMHQAGVDPSIGLSLYRYPGSNWNSPTLVKNKIWYNRGYKASAIYQDDVTPLYTINLDATAIKQIREYNKNQTAEGGYGDFELTCTDGAYCISHFLHDNNITTATGDPILDETNSTCAIAKDKQSFIACYTYR